MDKNIAARQRALSALPQVDYLLREESLASLLAELPRVWAVDIIRRELEVQRQAILAEDHPEPRAFPFILQRLTWALAAAVHPSLHRVVNATGVILHTNLGRAVLSSQALAQLIQVASGYSNLEMDEEAGVRGERYNHVRELLCRLTGAEDAMVVNNNAAAVLLMLAALALGGEVIVSRGEQVEVGGSFRIPQVMEQSGCLLVEVGSTNKTRLTDYATAINSNTAALLKVHTSNYRILGFTQEVPRRELVALAHEQGLPALEDLGSGTLINLVPYGLQAEPTVQEVVAAGMDLVTFSGDKLLGGPQAGIIVGKKILINRLKAHPLTRALRIDKLTLAALEATLRLYLNPETIQETIPVLKMLTASLELLEQQGRAILAELSSFPQVHPNLVATIATAGGGSLPLSEIPSLAIAITPGVLSLDTITAGLRSFKVPIFGYINKELLLLDLRTLLPGDDELIVEALSALFKPNSH